MTEYHPQHPTLRVERQNRKTLAMRVAPSGELVLYVPTWIRLNHPSVKAFVNDGMKKLAAHVPAQPRIEINSEAVIKRAVRRWARQIGVDPKRIQFREMTRKWGSCSSKATVTLNKALCYIPPSLMEYVVVHELVHLLILDHSPAFWAKLAEYMPDYQAREAELNTYRV